MSIPSFITDSRLLMKGAFFILITIFLVSCSASRRQERQQKKMNKAVSSLFKGQCPLERIEWMEVSEGYDRNTMLAIASEIEAAVKADASQIKNIAEGNINGKIEGKFSNAVEKATQKKVKVSQEFFELYQMMRSPICNIYQSVQGGFFNNNPQALMNAQNEFLEMNKNWLKFIQEEEKKSPN